MDTAQKILESKGYDSSEVIDILQANDDNLDMKVRIEFGVENESLHLWEDYQIGDADVDNLKKVLNKNDAEDIDNLLLKMDNRLLDLANEYPRK